MYIHFNNFKDNWFYNIWITRKYMQTKENKLCAVYTVYTYYHIIIFSNISS